ncbi:MAG: hypothetical protein CMM47_05085 [Rhodospirillaceae bacterium]|nr:hypothetical protein [Rhodospirillaceae bacterium]
MGSAPTVSLDANRGRGLPVSGRPAINLDSMLGWIETIVSRLTSTGLFNDVAFTAARACNLFVNSLKGRMIRMEFAETDTSRRRGPVLAIMRPRDCSAVRNNSGA